jgi:Holliday junction resolvase
MSRQWENVIAKEVYRNVDDVKTYRCGFSGSNAMPQPDVLVTEPTGTCHALELKGPIASDRCYIDSEDIRQLVACQGAATMAHLVVKFNNRKPLVTRYYDDVTGEDWSGLRPTTKMCKVIPPCFNPRVTDSYLLALDKPSTDGWDSARSSPPDWEVIANGLGIRTDQSTDLDV